MKHLYNICVYILRVLVVLSFYTSLCDEFNLVGNLFIFKLKSLCKQHVSTVITTRKVLVCWTVIWTFGRFTFQTENII